jgi:glycosyltransferase involved in cell wall biosynthesis
MRILWLSHFVPYPPRGGALQRTHHLLRQTAGRHDIDLLTLNQQANLPTPAAVKEASHALGAFLRDIEIHNIPSDGTRWRRRLLAGLAYISGDPYDVCWLRSHRFAKAVNHRWETGSYDLIHVDTIGLMQYVGRAGRGRTVLNHHNVESQMMARRAERDPSPLIRHYCRRDAAKLRRLEQRDTPLVSMNLVVSELDGTRLREVAPEAKTAVVENGVDVEYFCPSGTLDSLPGSLVFAGTMGWYPNLEAAQFLVREIWRCLPRSEGPWKLSLVGGQPPETLRLEARRLGAEVTGFVDDIRPYLQQAEIYVCPIRIGGGTRLKVLDALAMGRPMVATALAVEGLGLTQGLHYLRAETAPEFVAQILRLRADGALRQRLGSAGRGFVSEHFSWDTIGERLEAAYQAAAGHHRQPA